MRKTIPCLIGLGLCLVALSGCWLAPITITEADNGTIQTIAVGDTLLITLKGNASTGYQWIRSSPISINGDPLAIVSEGEYEVDNPAVCGGPGTYAFTYEAAAEGVATLTYEHRRPWEDETIGTFSVIIWVK